jgi:hypothetical protein
MQPIVLSTRVTRLTAGLVVATLAGCGEKSGASATPPPAEWRRRWAFSLTAVALAVAAAAIGCPLPHEAARPEDATFMAENAAAMARMMDGMTIQPSGDVDRDFVAMMIAHHQGAIEMAQAELRHGRDEQLRRLAQEIIVTQGQEIATMRQALGRLAVSPSPAKHQEPRE